MVNGRLSTPFAQLEATPGQERTEASFTNSIGMEFVLIPAGEFEMGSPWNEKGRHDDEGPVHRVKISNAFYMGKYEVTQKQWRDVMGTSPSHFHPNPKWLGDFPHEGDNYPVAASWNDAQEFIKKLNEREGTNKYRLPSEAEWEYAARAGTTTSYSFGCHDELDKYAWYEDNSKCTYEVGTKKPNPWGLYDMHGNVWEWVQDIYHNSYSRAPKNGSAWEGDVSYRVCRDNFILKHGCFHPEADGSYRVCRGGSWRDYFGSCRSANRNFNSPGHDFYRHYRYFPGFRLLRVL